jgi:dTDP-4-amino-4,6-dideoxygalactose transaminase
MKEIYVLSQKYGFKIIEDAAHAIGATYQNKLIGNCQYSDITVFSFHPVKLITTGEGGAAMTNSSELSEKMTLLRSHGITRDVNMMQKKIDAPWYYEQIALGFNYRMTDIQAALGISQLNRLDEYVVRRTEISEWYENNLKSKGVTPLIQKSDRNSAHHLFVVKVLGGTIERNKLYLKLRSDDIGVNLHYIPINQQPFFQKELGPGFNKVNVMNADKYFSQALTLPLYPNIKLQQLKYISHKVNGFYGDN